MVERDLQPSNIVIESPHIPSSSNVFSAMHKKGEIKSQLIHFSDAILLVNGNKLTISSNRLGYNQVNFKQAKLHSALYYKNM